MKDNEETNVQSKPRGSRCGRFPDCIIISKDSKWKGGMDMIIVIFAVYSTFSSSFLYAKSILKY